MKGRLRVLIVEDEPAEAERFLAELRRAGLEPDAQIVAGEAEYRDALVPLPDVVLSDFRLPGFDGLKALRILRGRDPDLPFIVVTGVLGDERAAECIRKGATDYVLKDRMARLGPAVENAVAGRRAREEKRRTTDALEKREAYQRVILENTQDLLLILDPSGRPRFYTPSVLSTFGRAPEEIDGRSVFEFVHPEDRDATAALFGQQLASQGPPLAARFRMSHRDGSWRTIEALGRNMLDHPEIGGILVTARDVSRRVEAERALRESEERFHQLVDALPEVFFLADEHGSNLFVSASYERIWGRPRQSLYGRPTSWLDLVHPEDRDRVRAAASRAEESEFEYRIVRDDGSTRWIRARVFPIRHERGESNRIAGIAEDVTAFKEAGVELRLQGAALSAAANAIVITGTDGRIRWVNPAFTRLTGYSKEEVIGQNPRILQSGIHDRDFYDRLWQAILRGETWWGEMVNRRKDGTLYNEEQTITPVVEDGVIGHFIAIKQDVTERKHAEQRLRLALERAKESDRLKSEFLANVSHEIRTPLNIIIGYNSAIAEHCRMAGDDEIAVLAERVDEAGERLMRTVADVLDMARLETGSFPVRPVPTPVASLVGDVVGRVRGAAARKGLEVVCPEVDPALRVCFDGYCLEHALANLIGNAVKFTDRGRVTVRVVRHDDGAVLIEVEDTGIGIDSRYLQRLFDPFSQEEAGSTRRFEGAGLGLALAKRYIEIGGATLGVRSEKGRGSCFTIRLPRELQLATASLAESPSEEVPAGGLSGDEAPPAVLVVEDDPATQGYMQVVLGKAYRPLFAATSAEALAVLDGARDVRAILIDVSLRGSEDGLRLTRRLRRDEIWERVPIIAATAHALPEDEQRCLDAGCDAYLAKPFHPDRLIRVLSDLLQAAAPPR